MTVFTKLSKDPKSGDKKEDVSPLVVKVEGKNLENENETHKMDEARIVANRLVRRWTVATWISLWLFALFIAAIGVSLGIYIYQHFSAHHAGRFRGWCRVPTETAQRNARIQLFDDILMPPAMREMKLVEGADSDSAELSGLFNEMDKNAVDLQTFFDEMIDIDMDDEEAVKIEVPKFGANRQGRFIHDFRFNYTAIVDVTGERCFVAPLDFNLVLAPTSFLDLLMMTVSGYYDRALDVVRETTRVVIPEIEDTEYLGPLINNYCENVPIYKLERITKPRPQLWKFLLEGIKVADNGKQFRKR
ncbi:hypothetical protein QYM36_008860 [Artemia franciscana]|uniref:Integral membrane protein 2 n=1 Tax=Artemia franciscana TaxID=6661 RepID=A0AA88HV20_ARTSF|nr:hypothetical protein QYM36_008860 [Artemia franciscana]